MSDNNIQPDNESVPFSPFVPRAFCEPLADNSVVEIEIYRGMPLFSDCDDVVQFLPEGLKGLQYLKAPFAGTSARCVLPGMVYLLTPAPGQSPFSLEDWPAAHGFQRNSLKPFVITTHPDAPYEVVVYQKLLAENESLAFGTSGILLF